MKFIKSHLILFLIILIAIILRFVNLSAIPVGFNDDEAAFGYNAYSILKTGRDEWGKPFPFPVFESFGDWKLIGYLYLTLVSVFIFGLNEFATRFPSAVFGVLTVFATYLLTKQLFDKKTALIASLLIAISPWQIIASRNAFESDLLSFFITMGTYFFVKALGDIKNLKYSIVFFVSSFYIYRSAWLFVPLFLTTIVYLHKKQLIKYKKHFTKNVVIGLIFILPLVPIVLTFKGQSRFIQESFITATSRIGITNDINVYRSACKSYWPKSVCTLIYNKYVFFTKTYVSNYFKNLSYDTFFDKANSTGFQSFSTRGVFYLFELPLLISGIIFLFAKKHPALKILIPWILICPVGASITGIGNYGRLNLIMPAPQIITAFGVISVLSAIKYKNIKAAAIIILAATILFSTIKLVSDMYFVEPLQTSRYQRYGYKQLFDYLHSQQDKYDRFYISRKIDNSHQYIQYLFSQQIDPMYFQKNVKREHASDGWVNMESIGNYYFPNSAPGIEEIREKSLLVTGEKEVTLQEGPIHIIRYLNGDTGFEVYDIDKVKEKLRLIDEE